MSKVRYAIALPSKFDGILESLSASEEVSKVEIIRRAIVLYDYLILAVNRGAHLFIKNGKDQREIVMPALRTPEPPQGGET